MCIFSLYRRKEGLILTHNRDEDYRRVSSPTLISKYIHGVDATYPLDIQGGGTWVLTSDLWTTTILNGALKPHIRKESYRQSRGVFPFELIKYSNVQDYFDDLELEGIEPFTQMILNNQTWEAWCLRWDEKDKTMLKIEDEIFVTSSATLYDYREKAYHEHQIKSLTTFNADNLTDKHSDLFWKKKEEIPVVKTTSMVQLQIDNHHKEMRYTRLI
ncbi:hypothetical protein GO491_09535 [Flavobacteriaceae bacterium Ap0902]|nr:hypothetical protein [Flavobacteriaceae bacterium Ap0902]